MIKAIDISKWNNDTPNYFKKHKANGVGFVFVQLTYAIGYPNPKRYSQVANTKKYIGNDRIGAYHFLYSNANALNEAKEFLAYVKQLGLSKSTPLMIDAEHDSKDANNGVNTFTDYLYKNGYKRVLVYSMANWFNSGVLNRNKLKCKSIWVANYGGSQPAISNVVLWQYTDRGLLNTDYNLVYDLDFLAPPKATTFLKDGSLFKIKTDKVLEYKDKGFRERTGAKFTRASILQAKPIQFGGIYRLETATGYLTANSEYIKKVK